jgi:predicted pyridoxine 5'-phosphate oxidase superfamily flavin-nucleotide-binding protein
MMTMGAPFSDRRPWSEGELRARQLAGAGEMPPLIRTAISAQQSAFFAGLPMVFVGGLDARGAPAASLLRGAPGFAHSPDPQRLDIAAALPEGDALLLRAGQPLALIGMDFAARRRNRVNGAVLAADAAGVAVRVEEAFGNCPKYILPRDLFVTSGAAAWAPLPGLDATARAIVAGAETFFLATRGAGDCDISHRGGAAGFARIDETGCLRVGDFPGNSYFNSFGNLLDDPRAALLFVDFPGGRVLHLQGQAEVDHDLARNWTFTHERAALLEIGAPLGSASRT